jgi:ubiquinone/menaquinone biosynthesis C-methylase UbiE
VLNAASDNLVLCPHCGQGCLHLSTARDHEVPCRSCSATYPRVDGVLDLLPGASPPRSPAQRTMESEAIVKIYESRWWRRSALATLLLGISFDREQELILRTARLKGAETVLDLACGSGIYARPFARALAAGTVVGLDISMPMLLYASRRGREEGLNNLVLIHGTASQLPFPPERFEFVNCCGALHLFADVPHVLGEIHKVLKPAGRSTIAASRRRSGALATRVAAYRRRVLGIDAFAPDELAAALESAGFTEVQCHHAQRVWLIMSARKRAGIHPAQSRTIPADNESSHSSPL